MAKNCAKPHNYSKPVPLATPVLPKKLLPSVVATALKQLTIGGVAISSGAMMAAHAQDMANEVNVSQASSELTQTQNQTQLQSSSTTNQQALIDELIERANQKQLATHPSWLRLHFYHAKGPKGPDNQRRYDSEVDSADFFVSEQGKHNPQAELEAFIRATVTQSMNGDGIDSSAVDKNDSVACRFPARTHWLKTQLGIEEVSTECPEFDAWLQQLDPQQLSVVHAEEYPDRLVSAFGHTLLLIDSTASLADPAAIDKAHALNDTVAGDPDDSMFKYAINSAFGGYNNDITIEPFPQKLAEYLQRDSRDVWTYVLDLNEEEVQQIMRHVWESKDLELPYYFTLDNCASEILRYIDIVRPEGNLLDAFKLAVVPFDVVRLLDKEGLLKQQRFLPADKTLEQAKRNNPQLSQLPDSSISADHKLVKTSLQPVDNNPLDAHSLQRFMVAAGSTDDTGYLSLSYRGGFNGPLDSPSGFPENFHLEAGSAEIRVYADDEKSKGNHDRVELQQLTLVRGRSFNPINTAYSGDSLLSSWGINVEATQVKDGSQAFRTRENSDNDSRHLVGSLGYEKGISAAFGTPKAGSGELPPHLCYAMGTGMAQVGKGISKGFRVGAGVNLGCRYQFARNARLVGELQLPYWYHGSTHSDQVRGHYWQPILSLGAQYDLGQNQAIRLQGSYELQDRIEGREDVQLAYVKYF
ncbi:DUF4105 domain-containing protein [Psychrobacter sp. FDAARGOS_221]|uniref:Lnb N-terminal periplasmic domain-containing protein n=1 Tax=Psychrobacter sp. FDAARGOS_221 TaxID=1975705 RepID=UPI000BB56E69|nr:DUF4105 domain-containing protein [Psychrobacter sp. FDAARGOS_221]PNK61830.1 DUF4105 domain-containing protein [Psychrobacter sp. FDAARGOS_221]